MRRFVGGLAAVAMALCVSSGAVHAAPGDTIDADYNFGNGGMNSFTFSEPLYGTAWVQYGEVTAANSCEGDPVGIYTYYPLTDYTVFRIVGFNDEGGYLDIRGTVVGTEIAGWAQHILHCAYEDGLYYMSTPEAMEPIPE